MTRRLPVRVVKVGGSLLDWSELPVALADWLDREPPGVTVLIAGGGEFAEIIRKADRVHALGESAAHWMCVDALSMTAGLLAMLTRSQLVRRIEDLPWKLWTEAERKTGRATCVFDPGEFLRSVEPHLAPPTLPHTWQVTSDSIAARIAQVLPAGELVLLKSCLPPGGADLLCASTAGYVDGYFPTAAWPLPLVRCVNLRSSQFEEVRWFPPQPCQ